MVRAVLHGWLAVAHQQAGLRRRVAHHIAKLGSRQLSGYWEAWRGLCVAKTGAREATRRWAAVKERQVLRSAWDGWCACMDQALQRRDVLLAKAGARGRRRTAGAVLFAWQGLAEEGAARRAEAEARGQAVTQGLLADAFSAWAEEALGVGCLAARSGIAAGASRGLSGAEELIVAQAARRWEPALCVHAHAHKGHVLGCAAALP